MSVSARVRVYSHVRIETRACGCYHNTQVNVQCWWSHTGTYALVREHMRACSCLFTCASVCACTRVCVYVQLHVLPQRGEGDSVTGDIIRQQRHVRPLVAVCACLMSSSWRRGDHFE